MNYRLFDKVIASDIPLLELQEAGSEEVYLSFFVREAKLDAFRSIDWFHSWLLPNGQVSLSAGRNDSNYWLRFPDLADFQINVTNKQVTCFCPPGFPAESIRHLLLDQVLPRYFCHLGCHVLHSACVSLGDYAIGFTGESGWGKSTIAAFLNQQGHNLLTDDCLMIKHEKNHISCLASYRGMRLFDDSLSFLDNPGHTSSVAHYVSKKRLIMTEAGKQAPLPLRALFILNDPRLSTGGDAIEITPITGATAAIELVKCIFALDIKDTQKMGYQLQQLAKIGGHPSMAIYQLHYPRKQHLLPAVVAAIKGAIGGIDGIC